ncbi:MAG: amino acid adenylation domain-containing protein [bacterium]
MRYLLHDVFLESVKKYPKNEAIYLENKRSVTYEELNTLSNRFAQIFKKNKQDIRRNPYVGVLSTVHINSIAAILGAIKIGGAYVPLDEYSPIERLKLILANTSMDCLVIDPVFYEKYKELLFISSLKTIIFLDSYAGEVPDNIIKFEQVLQEDDTEPALINQVSDDLVYVLHSSGSTGIPKGIMLTHRNARTFVDWMHKEFQLTSSDVVMSRAAFKFDLSVFDVFNTFKAGAKLVCYDWNSKREGDKKHEAYVDLIESQRATILYTTPSTYIVCMNKGNLRDKKLCLRTIMYAGEPFPVPQLRMLQEILPNTKIANIYGPTETNIITCYWIGQIPEDMTSIPLGTEVDDTEILVVSEDGTRICEPHEYGELWCRGGTVTLGYLGMQEKTDACFVQSPFHSYSAKFWRTGDYGYRDLAGVLHYKGRKDHMIKVCGYRIELGEIESALAQFKGIDEFCVVALPDEKYGNRLYCFYSALRDTDISTYELTEFLKEKIPNYMIPFGFLQHPVLPKTSSGKIDRVMLADVIKQKGSSNVV